MSIRLAPRTDSTASRTRRWRHSSNQKKFSGEAPLSIRPEHLPPFFLHPYKRFVFGEDPLATHPILITPLLFPPCSAPCKTSNNLQRNTLWDLCCNDKSDNQAKLIPLDYNSRVAFILVFRQTAVLETEGLAAFTYGWFVRRHINSVTFLCRYAFKICSWKTTSRFNCRSTPWRAIRSLLRSALARNDG